MNAKFDLSGKAAIVTGGGRGIGRAIALGLANSGASVAVTSRTQKEVDAVAEEIKKSGGKALAVVADLTVNEQLENLVQATVGEFGKIDILVNNAARSF
ncbi:MAG: putative dehydrogenase like protein, partial [Deltaproteobacteria bacterium]|nr:putative dehydrogenase like protein [Deltaproteobacteria bacterium]